MLSLEISKMWHKWGAPDTALVWAMGTTLVTMAISLSIGLRCLKPIIPSSRKIFIG